MNLIEFIGFIISLAALIFLFFKRVSEERYRRQHPEEFAEEERKHEDALKELLRTMHVDTEDEEQFSPPPRLPDSIKKKAMPPQMPHQQLSPVHKQDNFLTHNTAQQQRQNVVDRNRASKLTKDLEDAHYEKRILSSSFQKTTVDAPAYEVSRTEYHSRGSDLIKQLPSRKQMLIYKELFGKPLSMRNPTDDLL